MPTRILYVHATFVPPPTDLKTDRFYLLSENLEGDVLQPVWFRTPEEVEAVFGQGTYPVIRPADSGITGSFPGGTRESIRDSPLSGSICGQVWRYIGSAITTAS